MCQFPHFPGRLLPSTVILLLALGTVAGPARGQFNGNLFDPYQAAYRSSSLPVENNIIPGQRRSVTPPGLGTVPGLGVSTDIANSIPSGRSPLYGDFNRFGLDIYDPINDVYRQYDEVFNRVYRPNAGPDDRFAQEQDQRRELYIEAMRETDPQRRAELLRRYQTLSRRISLGMSPSASRGSLNAQARQEELSGPSRIAAEGTAPELPRSVRSYDDLVRWSRVVNRQALEVGVVRPDSN